MSDTRCVVQDVVSSHCCEKKNDATLHEIFSTELLCHDVIPLECGETHQCKSVNNAIAKPFLCHKSNNNVQRVYPKNCVWSIN